MNLYTYLIVLLGLILGNVIYGLYLGHNLFSIFPVVIIETGTIALLFVIHLLFN